MGLDWNPANKPKPGHEKEFERIVKKLSGKVWWGRRNLERRYEEISIPAYATLNAPRVGFDEVATNWAKEQYENTKQEQSLDNFLDALRGYYVLQLAPGCDGLPIYTNGRLGYVELCSFRAQFLVRCRHIIGSELLAKAYTDIPPSDLVAYGDELIRAAEEFSAKSNVPIPIESPNDVDKDAFCLHVVVAAGRWCRYWGARGHMLEAFF